MTTARTESPTVEIPVESSVRTPRDRSEEIYRKAAEIITRKGFDATSMNDIAQAVDLTKAGLYYYIDGKKELLYSIIKYAMDLVETTVVEPARLIADPEERLRTILLSHAGAAKNVRELTILAEEVDALAPEHRDEIIARKRAYLDFVRDTLRELEREDKLRDLDITIAALNVFATVLGMVRWYRPDGALAPDEIAVQTAEFVLGGLLKPT